MTVYQAIASSFQAHLNCETILDKCNSTNDFCVDCEKAANWSDKHRDRIDELCKEQLPHGSGFDCGVKFDADASRPDKLVFLADYHHMDENGYYDGWTKGARIVIRPDWQGINMKITGIRRKNRFDSDYWYDTFDYALNQEVK